MVLGKVRHRSVSAVVREFVHSIWASEDTEMGEEMRPAIKSHDPPHLPTSSIEALHPNGSITSPNGGAGGELSVQTRELSGHFTFQPQ